MTRQFTELVEDTRKQQLMARITAHKSLPFDSAPVVSCRAQFTPPRRSAPVQIQPTQMEEDYDFERDSLASQSSRTTRIRLQEKFRVIQVLDKSETTPADMRKWIEEQARAEMAKAGNYEDLPARDTESIGGFKRAHVRLQLLSLFFLLCIF